ncbi:MAG TPA: NTP transferase domain-containing protein [Rectinemataceae bacterium]|nr:NTP transferase domain-containing protein [Rectinemataceae bacterium]
MSQVRLDCVVPAAGASSRMGSFKPLLPFGPGTLVELTVGVALDAGCRVILIVGYRGSEIRRLFDGRKDVLVVENPEWARGMLGSIQTGLGSVVTGHFFTIPADMPLVTPAVYGRLREALEAGRAEEAATAGMGGAPGAAPGVAASAGAVSYFAASSGRAGHPVLIPSAWIPDILHLPPSARMRDFLETRPHRLVEAFTDAVLSDMDRPAEYEAGLARFDPRAP